MKKVSTATALASIIILSTSCKKREDPQPKSLIEKYVPLAVGNQWVYSETLYEQDSVTVRKQSENDTIKIIKYERVDGRGMYHVVNQLPFFMPEAYWYTEGNQLIEYDPETKKRRIILSIAKEGEIFQKDTINQQLARSSFIKSYGDQYVVMNKPIKTIEAVSEITLIPSQSDDKSFTHDFYGEGKGLVAKVGYYQYTPLGVHFLWELIDCRLN